MFRLLKDISMIKNFKSYIHPEKKIIPFEGKNNICFEVLLYGPLGVGLPQRHSFSICFAALNNFMTDVTGVHEFLGAVLGLEAVG